MPILTSLRASIGRKLRPHREVEVNSPDGLVELAHWIERPALRLLVPPELLRMQGGFVYGAAHPFVAALMAGVDALREFYADCQPRTICDYYGIDGHGRAGSDLPPWKIPWYGRSKRTPPPGELELGAEHGVSFYGPVTEKKIDLEMRRLQKISEAITQNGYDPDAFGDIQGYILDDGTSAAFFVRGGKHRAAALTALGHSRIPVTFRSGWPRLIHSVDAGRWPLVRSGGMENTLAKAILDVYIRGRTHGRGNDGQAT